jgi:hypothetical protein
LVSLAVTTSFSNAPRPADVSWTPRPEIIPVTGANNLSHDHQGHSDLSSAAEGTREAQAPRLWSGEVFLSDNEAPDVSIVANQDLQSICMSEDSPIRRHGGCVE